MDPIEKRHKQKMNKIGKQLSQVFPGYGFTLFIFDFNDKGRLNYISNAERESMIKLLEEFIEKVKGESNGN